MKLKSLAFAAAVVCGASLVALGMVAPATDNDCCSISRQPLAASELHAQSAIVARPATLRMVVMHVDEITFSATLQGAKKRPHAHIRVLDSAGEPVYGATVTGNWSGCFKESNSISGVTGDWDRDGDGSISEGETGWAHASATKTAVCRNSSQCYFIFTVTNVSLAGSSYDPGQNVETTGSQACNPFGGS